MLKYFNLFLQNFPLKNSVKNLCAPVDSVRDKNQKYEKSAKHTGNRRRRFFR